MPVSATTNKMTTSTSPVIRPGASGAAVRKVQERLAQLGFLDPNKITGSYDDATKLAIARFRKARAELSDKGAINDELRKSLRQMSTAWETRMPRRHRELGKKSEVHASVRLDDKTAAAAKKGVGEGANGEVVKNIENHLEAAGYDLGKADGSWGMRTTAAVKAFQSAKGLAETGVVDEKTWAALRKNLFTATTGTAPAQTLGEKSRAVRRTEELLHKLGYKKVGVDGFMGERTVAAVKTFQKKHDLKATGAVNARTLKAMQAAANPNGISPATQRFINIAKAQIGSPYVFGAEGPNAFDCSGLIYYALKKAGVDAPRLTAEGYRQHYASSKVDRAHLKPGDLVFYYYPNTRGIGPGHASHIEIYLGHGMTMGTDNPSEGARVEPIDWNAFIGGARVKGLAGK